MKKYVSNENIVDIIESLKPGCIMAPVGLDTKSGQYFCTSVLWRDFLGAVRWASMLDVEKWIECDRGAFSINASHNHWLRGVNAGNAKLIATGVYDNEWAAQEIIKFFRD